MNAAPPSTEPSTRAERIAQTRVLNATMGVAAAAAAARPSRGTASRTTQESSFVWKFATKVREVKDGIAHYSARCKVLVGDKPCGHERRLGSRKLEGGVETGPNPGTSNMRKHLKAHWTKGHDPQLNEYFEERAGGADNGRERARQSTGSTTMAGTTASSSGQSLDSSGHAPPPGEAEQNWKAIESNTEGAIVEWIIGTSQKFNVTEDDLFQNMFQKATARPDFPIRKRTYIAAEVERRVEAFREELRTVLASQPAVTLTTDLSTEMNQLRFLAVTVHFIDDNWRLRDCCLSSESVGGPGATLGTSLTALSVRTTLVNVMQNMSVRFSSLVAIVTDRGKNVSNAGAQLATSLPPNSLHAAYSHINCINHVMNNCVNDSLFGKGAPAALVDSSTDLTDAGDDEEWQVTQEEVEDATWKVSSLVKLVRSIVSLFRHSGKATADLATEQLKIRGRNRPEMLTTPCETRWNGIFDMLTRFHRWKREISIVLSQRNAYAKAKNTYLTLERPDGMNAEHSIPAILEMLEPITAVSFFFQARYSPTSSWAIPASNWLLSRLKEIVASYDSARDTNRPPWRNAVVAFGKHLIANLGAGFENILALSESTSARHTFAIASLLDPLALGTSTTEAVQDAAEAAEWQTQARSRLFVLIGTSIGEYERDRRRSDPSSLVQPGVDDTLLVAGGTNSSGGARSRRLGSEIVTYEARARDLYGCVSDLYRDLLEAKREEMTAADRESYNAGVRKSMFALDKELWDQAVARYDAAVLTFWRRNAATLPALAAVARRVLAIPAGSSASESLFSVQRSIFGPDRPSLRPDRVSDLVFGKSYIKERKRLGL